MIRVTISACAGNGLSFCRDRFCKRSSADAPTRGRDTAVEGAVAAQAPRARLRCGAERAGLGRARADVIGRVTQLGWVVPAGRRRRHRRVSSGCADVDGDDAGDDAADCGPDDLDLCRDRRHGGAQTRTGGVATCFDRRLCRGVVWICARCGVVATRAVAARTVRGWQMSGGSLAARSFSVPASINSPHLSRRASGFASDRFRSSSRTGPPSRSAYCGSDCGRE